MAKTERQELINRIRKALMAEVTWDTAARTIERVINAEIPGTPRITGRQLQGRVMYVAVPGKKKNREALSKRAGEVMKFLDRNRKASSKALQSALRVNRNVIAGAIHELKQAGLVNVETLNLERAQVAFERRK